MLPLVDAGRQFLPVGRFKLVLDLSLEDIQSVVLFVLLLVGFGLLLLDDALVHKLLLVRQLIVLWLGYVDRLLPNSALNHQGIDGVLLQAVDLWHFGLLGKPILSFLVVRSGLKLDGPPRVGS